MKPGRILEFILGVVFIVSATLKALDVYSFAVQVSFYGIVKEPESLVRGVAIAMIIVEATLGSLLLARVRMKGKVLAATGTLLVAFTALIAYGWLFKNLKDCGCFGAYIKMGPVPSMIKNGILLGIVALAWRFTQREDQRAIEPATTEEGALPLPAPKRGNARFICAAIGVGIVATAFAVGKPAPLAVAPPTTSATTDAPFAQYQPDLGGAPVPIAEGDFVVAALSATCEHCQAAVSVLNELNATPGVTQIVALVGGTQEEFDDFFKKTNPEFPLQRIDMVPLMSLVDPAPPRFYVIHDGKEVRHSDVQDPTFDDLMQFIMQK